MFIYVALVYSYKLKFTDISTREGTASWPNIQTFLHTFQFDNLRHNLSITTISHWLEVPADDKNQLKYGTKLQTHYYTCLVVT